MKWRATLIRLYRFFLILSAAALGGLLLYAITRGLVLPFGENVAALWSQINIIAVGYLSHRLLPRDDQSHVSRVLMAILASSVAAILSAWIFIVLLDFPIDSIYGQLLLTGAAAIAFAVVVFLPIHFLVKQTRRYQTDLCVLSGALIPSVFVLVVWPFGDDALEWIAYEADVFGAVGGSAAVAFMLVAGSEKLQ